MSESFDPLSDLDEARPPAKPAVRIPQSAHKPPAAEREPGIGSGVPADTRSNVKPEGPKHTPAMQYWLKLVERRRLQNAQDEIDNLQVWRRHSTALLLLLGFITTTILALNVYQRQREDNWVKVVTHIIRKDSRNKWFSSKKIYTINFSYVANYMDFQPGVRVTKYEWDNCKVGDPLTIQYDPEEPVRWKFPNKYSNLVRLYDKLTALMVIGLLICGALVYRSYKSRAIVTR